MPLLPVGEATRPTLRTRDATEPITADIWKGMTEMAGKGRQAARKPATKFAHLRKKMEKTRIVSKLGKKKK